MLDHALAYASIRWRVQPLHNIENGYCTCTPTPTRPKAGVECPSPGKHPRIKTGRAFAAATTDENQIRKWWRKWPDANIGIATGQQSRICVVDVDSAEGMQLLLEISAKHGGLPPTLMSRSGRDGVGGHFWFICDQPSPSNSGHGLDIRGDGGNLVAPPSMHISGRPYAWIEGSVPIAPMPAWLLHWFANREREDKPRETAPGPLVAMPAHLQGRAIPRLTARAAMADEPVDIGDVEAALDAIPNTDEGWDFWNKLGMAIWRATAGSDEGMEAFDYWSQKSGKYDPEAAAERWRAYSGSPPDSIGFGSLYYEARQANPAWELPSRTRRETTPAEMQAFTATNGAKDRNSLGAAATPQALLDPAPNSLPPFALTLVPKTPDNPLAELNEKYSVIGDVGGKCLVLGWVQSKADPHIKVPSFQTFKSFSERYAARYINVKVEKNGEFEDQAKQLGPYWLKWTGRRSFEGIDLVPKGEPVLPGNILNMWSGFAVVPMPGEWPLMRQHVTDVLASGDADSAAYILRWAAWAVQNPDRQAEVALVLRGGKGSGKGTFAHALRDIFGHHGMYVSSSKHMVGQFNSHLRNCILLFADEAFWAGDKQGESVLKGMLTEPLLMIEQKGIDASPWRNLLHVIMAANAEWVVPASHDERRFAMFDISDARINDRKYFEALRLEMSAGGLAAMLHDLLALDLNGWHPREIVKTEALREQKMRSLDARWEWLEGLLQDGRIPGAGVDAQIAPVAALVHAARDDSPKLREISRVSMGRFLHQAGCKVVHASNGNSWRFPALAEMRQMWEQRFGGGWRWREELAGWKGR